MDKLMLGVQVAIIGTVIVLTTLTILAILTDAMSKLLGEKLNIKTKAVASTIELTEEKEEVLTPQLLAAITAAVNATLNTRNTYKITTIKRVKSDLSPNWSKVQF